MINSGTIQILRKIVAQMGRDFVCQNPNAFAGAILDMCPPDDVKLLTNTLRASYGGKLMDYFRDSNNDAATWTQQKAYFLDESGMSEANAEDVLDALWQAMGWNRPKPTQSKPVKVESKQRKEHGDASRSGVAAASQEPPKVDPKFKKEHVDTNKATPPAAEKKPPVAEQASSGHIQNNLHQKKEPASAPAPNGKMANGGDQKPSKQQTQSSGWKLVPLLISVAWIVTFLFYQNDSIENTITRIQNGDMRLLFFLTFPTISAVLACAKKIPRIIKIIGILVLGFTTGVNVYLLFYLPTELVPFIEKTSDVLGIDTVAFIALIGVGLSIYATMFMLRRSQDRVCNKADWWKMVPLLISAVWIIIMLLYQNGSIKNTMMRIQNGDMRLLSLLTFPILPAVLVCVKKTPRVLKIVGVLVLGFTAGVNVYLLFSLPADTVPLFEKIADMFRTFPIGILALFSIYGSSLFMLRRLQDQVRNKTAGWLWEPLLISAVWIVIMLWGQKDSIVNTMTRIQNGDMRLLFFLSFPIIPAMLVCAKRIPWRLKVIGYTIILFTAGLNVIGVLLCLGQTGSFAEKANVERTILAHIAILGALFSVSSVGHLAKRHIMVPQK